MGSGREVERTWCDQPRTTCPLRTRPDGACRAATNRKRRRETAAIRGQSRVFVDRGGRRPRRRHASSVATRPCGVRWEIAFEDEVRFVHFLDRVGLLADGDRQGIHADRSAVELGQDRFEDALVHFVQAVFVDLQHGEGGVGDGLGDAAVVADFGEIADAAEHVVGDARGTAAAAGDFKAPEVSMATPRMPAARRTMVWSCSAV